MQIITAAQILALCDSWEIQDCNFKIKNLVHSKWSSCCFGFYCWGYFCKQMMNSLHASSLSYCDLCDTYRDNFVLHSFSYFSKHPNSTLHQHENMITTHTPHGNVKSSSVWFFKVYNLYTPRKYRNILAILFLKYISVTKLFWRTFPLLLIF